jgi:hypothetical protein
MGIFGGSGDYLDIPALHKKGIVKLPEPKVEKGMKVTKEGYVELTNEYSSGSEESIASNTPASSTGGFGSFFDAPASSSGSNTSSTGGSIFDSLDSGASSSNNSGSYFGNSNTSNSPDSLNIQHLKAKFEDIEFKIDRLIEKIDKMEDRLR